MSENSELALDPSAAKIAPLSSETKYGVESDGSRDYSSVGQDATIDQSRANPLGGSGRYQNPASHTDSHGSSGTDQDIGKARIEPLAGNYDRHASDGSSQAGTGLQDEGIDAARIQPLGEVREEMKP